ncbi:bifunctional aminoglycoside phosphotransferase/ATP-binding protein [Marinibacterium profundimaris]|uniref:Kinase n=1 Tax=Marinibacterium profundimaris TaxID=1679460 RepID=A0A225NHD2_9RHOB|nr:bifunctional aminoglycoside phosphotransferase/ATP-binding protein [Marinibacterium profundimaris]OWU72264.1 kinase [Marinibacterium profundimaris]
MSEDQSAVLAFLSDPATHGGETPEHVETHGAHVFLAGDRALKIKRAVAYDYMDFSTLKQRRKMLERELDLNRPAAPEIYLDVVPVTREGSGLAIGGTGTAVEWVLRMRRFPAEDELSAVADRGALSDALAEEMGRSVARYHAQAPRREGDGAKMMGAIVTELEEAFAGMTGALGEDPVARFSSGARAALDQVGPRLTERSDEGHLRRCHGDLHLRNLVLIDGRPVPFDALEFDEVLGTCDVLYDLAFLVMDLLHRDLAPAATLTLNAWLFETDGAEDAGLSALPLFLAIRAGIRAMVDVQTGQAAHTADAAEADARAYLAEALSYLSPPPPRLIAVGGPSGTGKTTLARRLAPGFGAAPGAVHLRSDLERKRLAGVDPLTRLPAEAYTSEATQAVYDRMLARGEALLAAGHSVILDATFMDEAERQAAAKLAARAGVPFAGIWLEAPEEMLRERVTARQGDASDADAGVVARQMARDTGPLDWARVDAGGDMEAMEAQARRVLEAGHGRTGG